MKIAFTGTSGSGKTTLATWLADRLEIPFMVGSSGTLYELEDRNFLFHKFGFRGEKGHQHVIQESHKNPELGMVIQDMVRRRRAENFRENVNFVTDRSPLDNWVYFMSQAGIYRNETECLEFYNKCIEMVMELDYLVYVPAMLPEIEDNGSRVANKYVQRMIDHQFHAEYALLKRVIENSGIKTRLLRINMVDLQMRKDYLINNLTTIN